MAEQIELRTSRPRDGRLDVLRGLCLLGMVLAHFIEQGLAVPPVVRELAMHWFRFAAGGFVLTSGLCIGAIHYQRALDPSRRLTTYVSLLKRAGLVLLVHYFATFLSLLVIPINGWPLNDVPKMIWDVLYLYTGYDLLLFYVFMLAVSPVVIEIVRRFGPIPMLVISVALFFVKYKLPYLFIWSIENHFPLIRWQLVFIVGLVFGSQIKQFDRLSPVVKWRLFASGMVTALAVATLSALERSGAVTLSPYLTVQKMPLTITEAARYISLALALAVLVDRAWPWLSGTRTQRILATLGVQSLMLWVVHVPVVSNLVTVQWLLALIGGGVLLYLAAAFATWLSRQWEQSMKTLPRLAFATPVIGSLIVCSVLIRLETAVQMVMQPAAEKPVMADADTDESIFFDEFEDTDAMPIPVDEDSILDKA